MGFQELKLDLDQLRANLSAPLFPYFAYQGEPLPQIECTQDALPVVCCSVSRPEIGDGDPYVQGSGDDTENWAHDLTPGLFWRHKDELCAGANDEELIETIQSIRGRRGDTPGMSSTVVKWTLHSAPLRISSSDFAKSAQGAQSDAIILCNEPLSANGPDDPSPPRKPMILRLGCKAGKLGSRDLRQQLPRVSSFVEQLSPTPNILVACDSGDDLSVGVALAILCQHYDARGKRVTHSHPNRGLERT